MIVPNTTALLLRDVERCTVSTTDRLHVCFWTKKIVGVFAPLPPHSGLGAAVARHFATPRQIPWRCACMHAL